MERRGTSGPGRQRIASAGGKGDGMLRRYWTVSYTHLDVYKRQYRILCMAGAGGREKGGPDRQGNAAAAGGERDTHLQLYHISKREGV